MLAGWQPGTFLIFSGPAAQQQEVAGDLLQSGGGAQVEGSGDEETRRWELIEGLGSFLFSFYREFRVSPYPTNVSLVYPQRIRIIFFIF